MSQNPKNMVNFGMEPKHLTKLIRDVDVHGLREWIEGGLPLDAEVIRTPLLHHFISCNAPKLAAEMIHIGVDADLVNEWNTQPALRQAVQKSNLEGVRCMLWGGADPTHFSTTHGTLLHSCVKSTGDQPMAVMERLVVAGTPMDTTLNNYTAEQKARHQSSISARHLRAYMALDQAIEEGSVSERFLNDHWKDTHQVSMTQPTPIRFLSMNVCWAWMDRIVPVLEAKGENISRFRLMQRPENLAWIVVGGALDVVDEHMSAQDGKGITLADFVMPDGTASKTLLMIADEWSERKLLESEWMNQQLQHAMRQILNALPEDAQDRIRNRHQLLANHQRQQPTRAAGGGL